MRRTTISLTMLVAGLTVTAGLVQAQSGEHLVKSHELSATASTGSIGTNAVTNLHPAGDTLWVGPLADYTSDGGATWMRADIDSLSVERGRMFSIDVEGRTIWIGIGYSKPTTQNGTTDFVSTALGFSFSNDDGANWDFRLPPLDQPDDTVEVYGVSTLQALPIIVPEQSPPFDIDYDPANGWVWTASWASGIRRSEDNGRTWFRVVLPPDTLDYIHPDTLYDFPFAPERNPNDEANNFLGFSVLVDESGAVWAGTAGGLNRSLDAREMGSDASWRRYHFDGTTSGLVGDWIISIEEQELDGPNAIWAACWPATEQGEDFGITVTKNGGETFEQVLIGERIYDFGFDEGRVYAAGENGLFITEDDGRTWRSVRFFSDASQPDRPVRPDATVFSVDVVDGELWVGTDDGLLKSLDGGETWSLFRAEVPLRPDSESPSVPAVDSYAYPNPYSPVTDGYLRVRYELESEQQVAVRIFDFSSRLVRTLVDGTQPAGIREAVWDGLDDRGTLVANGVYFYTVDADPGASGKIMVVD
jgi:hypothetical protein